MKLNIRNKLLLAFAAVIVLTGVVGYIGYNSANKINTRFKLSAEQQLQIQVAKQPTTGISLSQRKNGHAERQESLKVLRQA